MLKLDLGCGTSKAEGFIGFDRFPMPGVDIVGDLDKPLPFDSNSVDLVYASHSLEHIPNILGTMAEIYRILRHGGQLCIVAPYSEQKLNIANPYHLAAFNEHTPRFWTNSPTAGVDPIEYAHPHAHQWGIADSDHSAPSMDFRLVDMEFFYFPQYLRYSEAERREFRHRRIDVCDQVLYHLIAWKPEEAGDKPSYEELLKTFVPYVPDYVLSRRASDKERAEQAMMTRSQELADVVGAPAEVQKELIADMKHDLQQARSNELRALEVARRAIGDDGVASLVDSLANRLIAGRQSTQPAELANRYETEGRLTELVEALSSALQSVQNDQARLASLRAEIEVSDALTAEYVAQNEELKVHIGHLEYYIATVRNATEGTRANATSAHPELASVYSELSRYRDSRAQRLVNMVRSDALWRDVSSAFSELKTYTDRNLRSGGYRLSLSEDLRLIEYREYRMPAPTGPFSRISLGINPIAATTGRVGVEVVSADHAIIAQSSVDLSGVSADSPTVFALPSVPPLAGGWHLRVFVHHANAPVAVYELVNPSVLRRRPRRRAFVSVR